MTFLNIQSDTINTVTAPLATIIFGIGRFLQRMVVAIINSRQDKANYEVAVLLQRNEFRDLSVHQVLEAVKNGDLDVIRNM